MADVLNFKCPCCGAKLPFSGATGEMTCEYCDASFTMEQAKAAQEARIAQAEAQMRYNMDKDAREYEIRGKKGIGRPSSCLLKLLAQVAGAEPLDDEAEFAHFL